MHKESLCNLHLVRQFLADPYTTCMPRTVDKHWFYTNKIGISISGFNPFLQAVFFGAKSYFATWLQAPSDSARDLNRGDFLIREVLFAVHDYLHAWAYRAIQMLHPELRICAMPLTRKNIEQFVFCNLLTEAVATVGLDYWYLSTFHLNQRVPIGTNRSTLTTNYHEDDLEEYQRFCPDLNVQHVSFLVSMCEFYCSGIFRGFDISDLRRSPKTSNWLEHELRYGVLQRQYIREWLQYLSHDEISYPAAKLEEAVAIEHPWQRRLMHEMAELLWEKVKQDKLHDFPNQVSPNDLWRSDSAKPLDFRFVNINCVDLNRCIEPDTMTDSAASFNYLLWQYMSQYDCNGFDKDLLPFLGSIFQKRNLKAARALFRHQPRIPEGTSEPRDILFLN